MKPIAVLVVDDSAVVRQVVSAVLDAAPDIEVYATVRRFPSSAATITPRSRCRSAMPRES